MVSKTKKTYFIVFIIAIILPCFFYLSNNRKPTVCIFNNTVYDSVEVELSRVDKFHKTLKLDAGQKKSIKIPVTRDTSLSLLVKYKDKALSR